jgi:hypothetical protein
MFDLYSKAVLTVIAAALTGICIQGFIGGAYAQLGASGCGSRHEPCHVRTASGIFGGPLAVEIVNQPISVSR